MLMLAAALAAATPAAAPDLGHIREICAANLRAIARGQGDYLTYRLMKDGVESRYWPSIGLFCAFFNEGAVEVIRMNREPKVKS